MPHERPDWFRNRNYLHFDFPLGPEAASKIADDPEKVARHAFYPLIRYTKITSKVVKDSTSGKIERHKKSRDISYAAHADAAIYSRYCKALSDLYEQRVAILRLGDSIKAFRSLGENNITVARAAFEHLRSRRRSVALAMDISKFFDTLDHVKLRQAWCDVLGVASLPADHFNVFKSLTRSAWVERTPLYAVLGVSEHNPRAKGRRLCLPDQFRTKVRDGKLIQKNTEPKGIPQGTPISALLSNIYMLEFDKIAAKVIKRVRGFYVRYCDDILIITPSYCAKQIEDRIAKEIEKLKLEINPSKTDRVLFQRKGNSLVADGALQYLGFTFDGQRVLLRSAALARYSQRMKAAVRRASATAKSRNKQRANFGLPPKPVYKKKLLKKYSHLGKKNFITYAIRAADIMGGNSIRRQIRPLWGRLQDQLKKT